MALTKSEIDILRFIQKRGKAVTPREFVEAGFQYDATAVRLAMIRLSSQGWLTSQDVDKRVKSYALNKASKAVDFQTIEAI